MKRCLDVLCGLFIFLVLTSAAGIAAGVNMRDGEWETTMETKMEGLPFEMPPVTTKMAQCITKDDLVPKQEDKDQNCVIKDQRISGNKVTWKMICDGKDGRSEGEGEITYSGDSYKGRVKTRMTDKQGNVMTATILMNGRRLGDCTKRKKAEYARKEAQDKERIGKMKAEADAALDRMAEENARAAAEREDRKRSAQAILEAKVPEPDPSSCRLGGWGEDASRGCDKKFGKLDLAAGLWEHSVDAATHSVVKSATTDKKGRTADDMEVFDVKKREARTISVREDAVPLSDICWSRCEATDIRRSGNTITWKFRCGTGANAEEGAGGVVFSNRSYSGAVRMKSAYGDRNSVTEVRKISGRFLREPERDYTAERRGDKAKKEKATRTQDAPGDSGIPNPAKSIRRMFGF